jgi:hypothetical protein
LKERVSLLIDIKLKGESNTNNAWFKGRDGKCEACQIPVTCALESLATVMLWCILEGNKLEIREGLPITWSEALESKIHNLTEWDRQAC